MKKRVISLLLTFCMLLSLLPVTAMADEAQNSAEAVEAVTSILPKPTETTAAASKPANPFADVQESDWYYNAVQYARVNGFFSGTSETTFSPHGTMTRGMFVTVLAGMAGVKAADYAGQTVFSDVPADAYYAPYVAWASKYGITGGTGEGKFSPNALIDRQQMATFFVKYFEVFGVDYDTGANITTTPKDLDSVAPWAKDAVLKLWSKGLMAGDGVNFNPTGSASRAQAAAVCMTADKAVDTWYSEPGVESERVSVDPAIGEEAKPGIKPGSSSSGSSSGGTTTTTYYEVQFAMGAGQATQGVTLPETKTYAAGTKITLLPTPHKQNGLFLGWYYDAAMETPVGESDTVTKNMTLYARMGEVTPVSEQETPNYMTVVVPADQIEGYAFHIVGYTDDCVEYFTHISNLNAGMDYTVSGTKVTADFEPGQTYSVKLLDDAEAVFEVSGTRQPATIRVLNIITEKAEVQNLTLDGSVKYLPHNSVSDMTGNALDGLFSVAVSGQSGAGGISQNKNQGTFTYAGGGIAVGDTVAIYEGTRPDLRTDESQNEAVAYVKITAIGGDSYTYETADSEEVLFTPDVLPVTNRVAAAAVMTLDGDTETYNVTVYQDDMQFTDDVYAEMGLNSQTTIDVGDFIAFYSGDLGAGAQSGGYGRITEIAEGEHNGQATYQITYVEATQEEIIASMDIYGSRNEEIELTEEEKQQIESGMVEQAISSGFVEEAAQYLTALAIETDGFQELSDDLDMDLSSYSITFEDGTPVDPETMDLMAVKARITERHVDANLLVGTLNHIQGGDGIRAELVMTFKVEIGEDDERLVIELEAIFEQEVMLTINVSGGAIWKWKWIFPYIYDYQMNANIDVGTYTGIGITATARTQDSEGFDWGMSTGSEAGDRIISIGRQIKDLMETKEEFMGELTVPSVGMDGEGAATLSNAGLAERYAAMMENAEETWIEILRVDIFSVEGHVDPFHILCYGIGADFVVSANMYVTLGMTFEYGVAKRYNFSLMLFHKKSTNETIDLQEAHYQFNFYVMGTLGVRAGIELEVAIGLFSLKLDSIGICAEVGAYAQLWGYFYYSLSWSESAGKSSTSAGAMLIEIGLYLEISFKAQLFSSEKLTYKPTLYEHEWPLLTIGEVKNVYDFAYKDDDKMLAMAVPGVKQFTLSSDLFAMNYVDMKDGGLYGSAARNPEQNPAGNYDDGSESHYTVTLSNPKFSYDPDGNIVTVNPGTSVEETCQITFTWKHGALAFSVRPIERTLTIEWSDPAGTRYIAFDSRGGSAVDMISGGAGQAIARPANPAKIGYTFGGWYTDADCTAAFGFPSTMPDYLEQTGGAAKGITVYAKWLPATDTKYTVEHYQQQINGTYKLFETNSLTGTTGALTAASAKAYPGFTAKTFKQEYIAPDGTTVVAIYYLRNSYTVAFTYGEFAADNTQLTYSAKYGATLYAPKIALGGYEFAGFEGLTADADGAFTVTGNATYAAKWEPSSDTPYRVEHYVQRTGGSGYLLPGGDNAIQSLTGITGSTIDISSVTKLEDAGLTYVKATANGQEITANAPASIAADGSTVVKLYYSRKSFDLVLMDGETQLSSTPTVYGSILKAPTTPEKSGYSFGGWYTDAACSNAFTFGAATMPAETLTLYLKWVARGDTPYTVEHYQQDVSGDGYTKVDSEALTGATGGETLAQAKDYSASGFKVANSFEQVEIKADGSAVVKIYYDRKTYNVNFDSNGGTGVESMTGIRHGAKIAAPAAPTLTGYEFGGWYTDAGLTDAWNFSADTVTANTTLYAKWEAKGDTPYTVEHYRQNVDGSSYDLADTEDKSGRTGGQTAASAKDYEGFTAQTVTQATIAANGSTVVKVYYTRNQYTLTFDANGGEGGTSTPVYYGAAITAPAAPAKTGYTFGGWGSVASTMPAADTTYTAQWTANTYTVVFEKNAPSGVSVGGAMSAQSFTYGTQQALSANAYTLPANSGYTFLGWAKSAEATASDYADGQSVSSLTAENNGTVTLYAVWQQGSAVTYTVNHYQQNVDGSGYALVDTQTPSGIAGTLTAAAANTYEGFTAQSFDNVGITAAGAVVDIYYTRNQYTLTFDANGGEGGASTTVYYGAAITRPADPTRTGYTFGGWGSVASTMPAANTTYTAQWTANTYAVAFEKNAPVGAVINGTMANQSFAYDTAQALNANAYVPAANSGYVFMGWATSADGGMTYSDGQSVSNLTAERSGTVTLYAVWELGETVDYTVEHYQQNVDGDGYTKVGTQTLSGTTGTLTNAIANTYEGFTAQSVTQQAIKGDGSTVVEVKYTRNQYTLTFDANGGEGGTSTSVYYGAAITAPATPTKTGYTTGGWDNVASTMPAADTTYTVQWTANTYTVVFDNNSGKLPAGVTVSGEMANQPFTYDVEQALRSNAYTLSANSGYSFLGWAKSAEAAAADYADGQSVSNLTAENNGTATLYAVWKQGSAVTYTVNHYQQNVDGNGYTLADTQTPSGIVGTLTAAAANTYQGFTAQGVTQQTIAGDGSTVVEVKYTRNQYTLTFDANGGEGGASTSVYYGAAITRPADPTRTGYTFKGWGTMAATMPAANTTYTAQWTANTYTVAFEKNAPVGAVINGTMANQSFTYDAAQALNANAYVPAANSGYVFMGWATASNGDVVYSDGQSVSNLTAERSGTVTLYAVWELGETVDYTVEHYRMDLDGVGYTKVDTQTLSGTTGTLTNAIANTYEGFTAQSVTQQTIQGDGTTVVEVKYTRNQYTLTFDANGGSGGTSGAVYYGAAITAPAAPTKTGYTTGGWDNVADTMPAADTTYTVQWTANTYTVSFNKNAPSGVSVSGTMDDQTFAYDEMQLLTANGYTLPEYSGYTFLGWAKSASAASADYFDGQPVGNLTAVKDGTVTLYAVWQKGDEVNYTVNHYKMDLNGEYSDAPIVETLSGAKGTLTAAEANTYEGFTLVTTDITQQVIGDEAIVLDIYYSRNRHTLTFQPDNGEADTVYEDVYYGAAIAAPTGLTKTGYEFSGWGSSVAATMPDNDLTYTAQWTIRQYTITFDTDGGSAIAPITQDYGTAVTAPDAPTRIGYTFAGWNKEIPETMPAENMTVTAAWNVEQYTITFANTGDSTIAPITQDYGTAVTAPDAPTRIGYTFAGWNREIPETMPAEDMIITATWTANTYTVAFDANGGECSTADKPVTYGGTYGALPTATRTGYRFDGWYTAAEGGEQVSGSDTVSITSGQTLYAQWTVKQYTITFANTGDSTIAPITQDYGTEITDRPDDPVWSGYTFAGWDKEIPDTMPAADMTITAQWDIQQYTITYELDGGTNDSANPASFTSGELPFTLVAPTKTGHHFVGWTGSNGDVPQTDVTISVGTGEDLSFTANWEANTYTVQFISVAGGVTHTLATTTATYGQTVTMPVADIEQAAYDAGLLYYFPEDAWYTSQTQHDIWTQFYFSDTFSSDEPNGSTISLYSPGDLTDVIMDYDDLKWAFDHYVEEGRLNRIILGADVSSTTSTTVPFKNVAIMGPVDGEGDPLYSLSVPLRVGSSACSLTLKDLKITDMGSHNIEVAYGSLTMENCVVTGNDSKSVSSSSSRGVVYNSGGTATITDCIFSGNAATSGGAVYSSSTSVTTITGCTFENNVGSEGGAVKAAGSSTLNLINCTFTGNTATTDGGAVYGDSNSTLNLTNCTFEGNTVANSGTAIYYKGTLNQTDCTLGSGQTIVKP